MIIFENKEIFKLWFFPFDLPLMPISTQEKKWKKELSNYKKYQFHYSRGYARIALSKLFNLKPLQVPLFAAPNKPPLLDKGYGHISISHCNNGLIIGWAKSKLGVDIELIDRHIDSKSLSEYLFSKKEKDYLYSSQTNQREKFISIWVRKEALVKFDHGNIIRDFRNWEINFLEHYATYKNKSKKIFVNCFKYKKWLIGLASEEGFKEIKNNSV